MAVITKFFIVRDGVELDKVFTDKKEAEGYDKMLDAAEKLAEIIRQAELPEKLDATVIDEISICLAKNAPEVTKILKGVRAVTAKKPAPQQSDDEKLQEPPAPARAKKRPGKRPKAKPKADPKK